MTKQTRLTVILGLIIVSLISFFLIKKCSDSTENDFSSSYKAEGSKEREKFYDSVYKGMIIDRKIVSRRGKSGEIYTYYIVEVPEGVSDWKREIKISKEQYFEQYHNKNGGLRFGDEIYYKRFDLQKVSEEERNIIPDYYLEKIINKQEKEEND